MSRALLVPLIALILYSCSPSRRVAINNIDVDHANGLVDDYARLYAGLAMSEMSRTGIPASITLAQGMIESDFGRSRLATQANNHFGIKCHGDWNGRKIYHDDDRRNECFRKYDRVEESFIDHSDFLKNGVRYSFLFDLKPDNYKDWARGLKQAGYATNPRYANMLIDKIEEERLYLYDREVLAGNTRVRPSVDEVKQGVPGDRFDDPIYDDRNELKIDLPGNRVMENNRIDYIVLKDGDTYESIIEDYDLLSWELFRYNDLEDEMEPYAGQVIYLQPKRNRAEAGKEYHILKEGESLYLVSQMYGVKLKSLCEMNRLDLSSMPPAGTELWLRRTKPEGL